MNVTELLKPVFWNWWLLGLVLIIFEMLIPGTFLLWSGIAALLVGVVVWLIPTLSGHLQWLLFALLTLVALGLGRRYIQGRQPTSDAPLLNQRGQHYVGRVVVVENPIVNGQGKIRIEDSIWKIHAPDCPAGSRVRITGIDGVVLQGEVVVPQAPD